MDQLYTQSIAFNIQDLIRNIINLEKENQELLKFKQDAEDMCESVPVVENMLTSLERSENDKHFLLKEKEILGIIDDQLIDVIKENDVLFNWYIKYKLGVRLYYDYDLIEPTINEYQLVVPRYINSETSYHIVSDKIVGYKPSEYIFDGKTFKLNHLRFDFDAQNNVEHNFIIINLFEKFYKNNIVVIRSYKGAIYYKIIKSSNIYECGKNEYIKKLMNYNDEHWYRDECVDVSGESTSEIINKIIKDDKLL